jgi:hypothetical protein
MHRTRYLIGVLTLALAIAGAVGLWRLLDSGQQRPGLHARVEFRDARSLRAGADVRYRGVTVGSVLDVKITGDGSMAVVELLLDELGSANACVNSSFWIVSPRFSGLATGATGLDTLVRDAYVAFITPAERGSPLRPGSRLGGSERPPSTLDPESLEPLEHGDLLMSLLVPENHGLKPGSPVLFRGTTTGDVRSVELSEDGTYVEVRLRIARRYRQTVTDKSTFWVARPYVSGSVFGAFTVSDVNALLLPFVNYSGHPGEGVPVEDGWRTTARASRPDEQLTEVNPRALQAPKKPATAPHDPLQLVRIVYAAVSRHTIGSDGAVHHEGSGVLYLDGSGRAAVLTTRSIADGSFTEAGWFGSSPDIAQEQINVLVPGGPVLRGHRVWVAPDGRDLAVLVLDEAPPDLLVTPASLLDFEPPPADLSAKVRAVREGGSELAPAELHLPDKVPESGPWHGGAVQLEDGRVVALFGWRARRTSAPAAVGLDAVPADLRARP